MTVDTSRAADVAEIAEKIAHTLGTNHNEQTTLRTRARAEAPAAAS
ncbi:hypothetical protein OG978_44790 (plasmid) [Streptomyces sp. NBC_01591]|nr:hypothetical protein [Streptomyces sp. NBC_01591]WSD74227.1 hypothetical protein OG978_44790 [Streptomyces sp. NBC_01591]